MLIDPPPLLSSRTVAPGGIDVMSPANPMLPSGMRYRISPPLAGGTGSRHAASSKIGAQSSHFRLSPMRSSWSGGDVT
jgi:hypothetical protein